MVKSLQFEQKLDGCADVWFLAHFSGETVDTSNRGATKSHDGFVIRRNAIETGVNVLTAIDTARALVTSPENREEGLNLVDIAKAESRGE